MSAYALLYTKFAPQGWTDATKLDLCMEFIDSLEFDEVFDAFLKHKIEEEYWEDLEEKADEEEIE